MSIYDAAMKLPGRRRATVSSPARSTAPAQPRLGGQGHAAAGHQGGGGAELRAHPPQQPGRHGRAAAAVQGRQSWEALGLKGDELIDIIPAADLAPQSDARLVITRADGSKKEVRLTLRIDTPIEVEYFRAGGILPYVLRQLLG
jgi:aconitate hydratase